MQFQIFQKKIKIKKLCTLPTTKDVTTTPNASEGTTDVLENPDLDPIQNPFQAPTQDQDRDPPQDPTQEEPHMMVPSTSSGGAIQVCQLVDGEK